MRGILIGATLELIFLGNVAIGAAHPPDIVTEVPYWPPRFDHVRSWSSAPCHPVSMLAQTLGILVRVVNALVIWRTPLCGLG